MPNTSSQKVGGRIRFPAPPNSAPRTNNATSTGFSYASPATLRNTTGQSNATAGLSTPSQFGRNTDNPYQYPFSPAIVTPYNATSTPTTTAAVVDNATTATPSLGISGFSTSPGTRSGFPAASATYSLGQRSTSPVLASSGAASYDRMVGLTSPVSFRSPSQSQYLGTSPRSPVQQPPKELPPFLLSTAQGRLPALSSSRIAGDFSSPQQHMDYEFQTGASLYSPHSAASPMRPSSSHSLRRKDSFGTNDMLSSVARFGQQQTADATSLGDDAPPVISLNDMDMVIDVPSPRLSYSTKPFAFEPDPFLESSSASSMFGDPRDLGRHGSGVVGAFPQAAQGDTDIIDDIYQRCIMVSGIPSNLESRTLETFQELGRVVDFVVDPERSPNSMVIVFSEGWHVRRILSWALDNRGRVMLRDSSHSVRVDQINDQWIDILIPRWRGLGTTANGGGSNDDSTTKRPPSRALSSTSFLADGHHPQHDKSGQDSLISIPTSVASPRTKLRSSSQATPQATRKLESAPLAKNVHAPGTNTTPMKPRNGIIQSAMDVLFGW
ncbi:hypothetical protein EV182_000673 [Spiromyces aspiralis]|uniref:Uncharacterized protein n=1 Tax=Spiromyces aspiralis TaxID=68401 RepID=A0ACC1HGZ5_9FUNG|nr:hypothetical protein EV182_000673 [Spiromyces aspiralis]